MDNRRRPREVYWLQEAVRLLRVLQPRAFVAENVRALRSAHGIRAPTHIRHDIARSGYRVADHLMRAHDHGVAQMRARIFPVGVRSDPRRTFDPPAPSMPEPLTVAGSLGPPRPLATRKEAATGKSETTAARLRHIRPDTSGRANRCGRPRNIPAFRPTEKRFRGDLRRLHPHRPDRTVVASGGGAKTVQHRDPMPLTER